MALSDQQTAARPLVRHQPGLDGLRGLAVLAVIAYHAGVPFAQRGGAIGVTLFFVLSGYLITTLLLREIAASSRVRLVNFYARRALRLLPAMVLVVAAVSVYAVWFAPAGQGDQHLRAVPYVLLYLGNWYRAFHGFGSLGALDHTWSLSVEEQFYLLWPPVVVVVLLAARVRRRWRVRLLAVALVGSVLPLVVRLLLWAGPATSGARVYNGTDTIADALMMGCALALCMDLAAGPGAGRPGADRLRRALRLAFWPATALLVADAVFRLGGHSRAAVTFDLLWGPTVFGLASAVVVGHVVVRSPAALRWAPLRAVGLISYGLYLWHYPLLRIVAARAADGHASAGGRLLAVVLAFLAAVLSYALVERPLLRLKRYFPAGGTTRSEPLRQAAAPVEALSVVQ
jgi:peptidoglycan/LPS O-acetylase OafA/YrhL